MFTNIQILEAASIIRPKLVQLIDAGIAHQIDTQLAQLLNNSHLEENAKVDRILDIFDSYPDLNQWLDEFLEIAEAESTRTSKGIAGYSRLPGVPALQAAKKYICPIGNDYTEFLEDTSEVPLCPTHLVPLKPA